MPGHFNTAGLRQADIHDDDIWLVLPGQRNHLVRIVGFRHKSNVSLMLKYRTQGIPKYFVVINQHESNSHFAPSFIGALTAETYRYGHL